MEDWRDATSRQVKLLTRRLNELLSSGQELLHAEFGVDLGLKPDLIPPWVILLAACVGLVLMVALWASLCGRCFFKKRPAKDAVDADDFGVKGDDAKAAVKSEEQKKKKKKPDKKAQAAQPNGRAVPEPQDEAIVSDEIVPHHQSPPPDVKTEKASEIKKSKKKGKQVAKDAKTVTADGKEPEEGTWETKVSNKEKREQRKKEKTSSDGSASPGGGDAPSGSPQEPPRAAAAPAGQKKKKGESPKVKVEKVEAAASPVSSSEPPAGSAKVSVKAPSPTAAQAPPRWTAKREAGSLWGTEIDGSWTVIESGMKTSDQNQVSFSGVGGSSTESKPMADLPWLGQPKIGDEWSGLNGGSVDTSSDWNAPSEAWGNYEEPGAEPAAAAQQGPAPEPAEVHLLMEAADEEEEEKEKAESAADGAAKMKRKKKKKKKTVEEGDAGGQESEEPEKEVVPEAPVKKQSPAAEARVERPTRDATSHKPPVTHVPQKPTDGEPTAKQNNLPAPTQHKKLEESQAPKPAKKKKARRET